MRVRYFPIDDHLPVITYRMWSLQVIGSISSLTLTFAIILIAVHRKEFGPFLYVNKGMHVCSLVC